MDINTKHKFFINRIHVFMVLFLIAYTQGFSNPKMVHVMRETNCVYKKLRTVNVVKCAEECIAGPSCFGVNYHRKDNLCELIKLDLLVYACTLKLQPQRGYVYITRNNIIQTLPVDNCSTLPCPITHKCITTPYVTSCVPDHCDQPPTLSYGRHLSNMVTIGAKSRYKCAEGFMGIGDPYIRCQTNASWSSLVFNCNPSTCASLTKYNIEPDDGEYWLYPHIYHGHKVRVYCHNLGGSTPTEYITVDPDMNISEGSYVQKTGYCQSSSNPLVTKTISFLKIKINIDTMVVDTSNFTFTSVTEVGHYTTDNLRYGKAGTCIKRKCNVHGYFHINTAGTGLIVDPELEWRTFAWRAYIKGFQRSADGTDIQAWCGGYCGGCSSHGSMALRRNTEEDLSENDENPTL